MFKDEILVPSGSYTNLYKLVPDQLFRRNLGISEEGNSIAHADL